MVGMGKTGGGYFLVVGDRGKVVAGRTKTPAVAVHVPSILILTSLCIVLKFLRVPETPGWLVCPGILFP